jgi:hypothetical protein
MPDGAHDEAASRTAGGRPAGSVVSSMASLDLAY